MNGVRFWRRKKRGGKRKALSLYREEKFTVGPWVGRTPVFSSCVSPLLLTLKMFPTSDVCGTFTDTQNSGTLASLSTWG